MTELNTEEKQHFPKREPVNNIPLESKLQLLFLGLLSISFVGYFALRKLWIGFIFGHIAALSIMGFYGCLAGAIAKILGGISAFLLAPSGEGSLTLTCGGWVSLGAGIVVVISYSLIKKKKESKQLYSY
jgi:hypothetical protein